MVPLISMCGCGHTGSSILARILGTHSSIHFITMESGMFLANRFFSQNTYYEQFQQDAINAKKSFVLEKTPRHIWHVDYIRRCYPNTRFILTTRNCFDTIASLYERTKNFKSSLLRYQDDSILTLRQIDESDVFLVKHEDLIADPSQLLESLCTWLGLTFESSMLNYSDNPIDWNLHNPYSFGTLTSHDLLRNKQVNSPLKSSSVTWKERLPVEYHEELISFFSVGSIGHSIVNAMGY